MATATMTKTRLIAYLTDAMPKEKSGGLSPITRKTAALFLDELAAIAIKETKKSGVFVLPGIGRLVKAFRKARIGRNPQTGEQLQIKAKTVVKFRVAKSVKEAIAPVAAKKAA